MLTPAEPAKLSDATTSPRCNAGTSTRSTYDGKAGSFVVSENANGARTPSSPKAVISVIDSHEAGADAMSRLPHGARA